MQHLRKSRTAGMYQNTLFGININQKRGRNAADVSCLLNAMTTAKTAVAGWWPGR
jgi:hypothetical protein